MAESNGRVNIKVEGVEYPLLFNRAAVQEMSDRSTGNPSGNAVKLLIDLIYSGMLNYALFSDSPFPVYPDVYGLVVKFEDEEDALEQEKLVWETFETSRHGAEWLEKIAEAKKKMEGMKILNHSTGKLPVNSV